MSQIRMFLRIRGCVGSTTPGGSLGEDRPGGRSADRGSAPRWDGECTTPAPGGILGYATMLVKSRWRLTEAAADAMSLVGLSGSAGEAAWKNEMWHVYQRVSFTFRTGIRLCRIRCICCRESRRMRSCGPTGFRRWGGRWREFRIWLAQYE